MKCRVCGAPVIFARTLAGPNGRGGKPMPLDPAPSAEGNVAVRIVSEGVRVCRVLSKGETHDMQVETLHMPHFATCLTPERKLVAEVEAFLQDVTQ